MMNEENLSGSEDVVADQDDGQQENVVDADFDPSRAWINKLPENYRDKKSLQKYRSGEGVEMVEVPVTFVDGYDNLNHMLGSKQKVPDSPEEQDAFYEDLGWKSEFEDYSKGIERKEVPEGITYDTEFEDYMLQMAHEARVPQAKAQELYNKIFDSRLQDIQAGNENATAYKAKVEDDFKREFGGDLDTMKTRARVAIEEYESPEFIDILNNAEYQGVKVGDHPGMFKFFSKLGKEKLGLGNERGKIDTLKTSDDVQERISKLREHPGASDSDHPDHARIMREMERAFLDLKEIQSDKGDF